MNCKKKRLKVEYNLLEIVFYKNMCSTKFLRDEKFDCVVQIKRQQESFIIYCLLFLVSSSDQ